nr:hypothetical protein [Tanacetum cinerariifolium]
MEEIDLSFTSDYPLPSDIEEDDYDSERDILILEELLSNDSLSLLENESFHFDIPSSSRPPAKPPDAKDFSNHAAIMEGSKKRRSITEALEEEAMVMRPVSKKKKNKGLRWMSAKGNVPHLPTAAPKDVEEAHAAHNMLPRNVLSNESMIMSQDHSKLKNDLFYLKSKKSLLEQDIEGIQVVKNLRSKNAGNLEELSMLRRVAAFAKESRIKLYEELDGLQPCDYHPEAKNIFDEAAEAFYKLKFPYISLLGEKAGQSLEEHATVEALSSTATIRNLTFLGAFGKGPTMSMPHCIKGHAAVTEVLSCLGNLDTGNGFDMRSVDLVGYKLIALTHSFEAARYTIRLSPALGAVSVGSFSIVLKKGKDFSLLLDKNMLRLLYRPFLFVLLFGAFPWPLLLELFSYITIHKGPRSFRQLHLEGYSTKLLPHLSARPRKDLDLVTYLIQSRALRVLSEASGSSRTRGFILDRLRCILVVPLRVARVTTFAVACKAYMGETKLPLFRSLCSIGTAGDWLAFQKRKRSITAALEEGAIIIKLAAVGSSSKHESKRCSKTYSAHNVVSGLHRPSPKNKLDSLSLDDLANVYDVHALNLAMIRNMLTNEYRVIACDYSKLKGNFVSLRKLSKLRAMAASAEDSRKKLSDELGRLRPSVEEVERLGKECKDLEAERGSLLSKESSFWEEVNALSSKLKITDLEKLVRDFLPLAIKKLLSSEHFNSALGDLQQKSIIFGRSQALYEVRLNGVSPLLPFRLVMWAYRTCGSSSTHSLCALLSLFSNPLTISLFVTSVRSFACGWYIEVKFCLILSLSQNCGNTPSSNCFSFFDTIICEQ